LLEGDTEQAAMAKIESLVRVLPGPALRLIKYVFDFLDLVASQSSANKMHLQNLAVRPPIHITHTCAACAMHDTHTCHDPHE
jgi:hypothetical protein